MNRGIAASFALLIGAGFATCMFLETVVGPVEYHYHRPRRDELSDRLFEAYLQGVLYLMRACGLSDTAIRIVLLVLIALCVAGVVAIIKLLGWIDPARRSGREDGGPVDRSTAANDQNAAKTPGAS